ncbi:ChbG/HpnK family deacetylase [bacterium]|nr:ChbG/HpnK family deacetylase [bacterium]
MINKKFILNADDFGLHHENNQAILEGYINGFLTSASLCANGEAYESAIHDVLPDCPNLGLGVHLNIMEGKSLTKCSLLTDKNGIFNVGYGYLMLNAKKQEVQKQIENEFRAQIEKIQSQTKVDHIDSHVHTHAIPEIFKITCKLAKEYNIKYVRTQYEELYFIPKLKKHLNFKYPINLIKIALLQYFTKINKPILEEYGLRTNDYVIGVGYTGIMDNDAVEYGAKAIEEEALLEAIIHPQKYEVSKTNKSNKDFEITLNKHLQNTIIRLGFEITNYKKLV